MPHDEAARHYQRARHNDPPCIDLLTAFADLRRLVLDQRGIDITKASNLRTRVMPIGGTGSRTMGAIVVGPAGQHDAATLVAQSFVSIYGEMTPWMIDAATEATKEGKRASFAVPMAHAIAV